jgi:hypothetical protein
MTKTEDVAVEREVATMHEEWAERRAERDLQAAIRLQNLGTWVMFRIVDGGIKWNPFQVMTDTKLNLRKNT